jgi:CRP-like cAMP-binding protein
MSSGTIKSSPLLERKFIAKGTYIIREGEEAVSAYLVQSGKVRVTAKSQGVDLELTMLGTGEIFGEMALISSEKRTASIQAIEDTVLILITKETLRKKLEHTDPTIRALVPMLLKRISKANESLLSRGKSFDDIVASTKASLHDAKNALDAPAKRKYEASVEKRFEAFLSALEAFQKQD